MTTFTLKDYIDNMYANKPTKLSEELNKLKIVEESNGSMTVNVMPITCSITQPTVVEPIPFAGMVAIQDKEDTEAMLRHQLQIVQAECMRLKELLTKNGIQH